VPSKRAAALPWHGKTLTPKAMICSAGAAFSMLHFHAEGSTSDRDPTPPFFSFIAASFPALAR